MDKALALGIVLSLQDKLSPGLTNVLGKVKNVSAELNKFGDVKNQSAALRSLYAQKAELKKLAELREKVDDLRSKRGYESTRIRFLEQELKAAEEAGKATVMLSKRLEAARRRHNDFNESLQLKKKALNKLQPELEKTGVYVGHMADSFAQADKRIEQATKKLERYHSALKKSEKIKAFGQSAAIAGTAASAVGYGGREMLKPTLEAFAELENAGTQLKVSMMGSGGVVSGNFEKINALAEKLGNRLPGTTSELQTMMASLIQQGASEQAILGGLGVASANLGVVLKKPYKDAAEFAARLQDATGATEDQMMGLMDVIQRTFYLGTDSDNMLQGMTKLSPVMDIIKKKGLEATQVFAPLLVMADQAGMQGEAAGNSYRKIFQAAMNADDKVSKVNKALRADGHKINLDFTNGKGEFGGMDKLFAELDKLKALNTQDRLGAIKGIFGDDAETLQAVSLLIENGVDGYADVQRKMAAQADIQARVNAQLGTLTNLWEAVTGTFTNLKAGFVAPIAGDLKEVVNWLSGVQEQLSGWMKDHPKFMRVLALSAFGIVALATVLGVLLVGVAAVATGIGALWLKLWAIKSAFGLVTAASSGLWPMLVGGLSKVGLALRMLASLAMAHPVIAIVVGLATAAYLIYANWDKLGPMFARLWSGISQGARDLWQKVTAAFAAGWSGLTMWFSGVVTRFTGIGGHLVDGLINGIRSRWEGLKATIMELAQSLPEPVKQALDIHSPSRVFAQIGGHVTDGLTIGLQGGAADTLNEIQRISRMIAQTDIVMPGANYPVFNAQTGGTLSELQRLNQLMVQPGVVSGGRSEPIMAGHAVGNAGQTLMQSVSITIHAAPGMDPTQIATEVQRQLALAQRNARSAARSNLYDEF